MPDQDLGDLLRSASPLPSGLPEEARHRLERLAAEGAPRRAAWGKPVGLGLAAGLLIALGGGVLLRPPPALAWERQGVAWHPLAGGGSPDPAAWREIRLADGTTVDAAPGARLEVVGRRPGLVARLEEGTAFFSVPPGRGEFRVAVPGGRLEVVGTAFGVSVGGQHSQKGEIQMKKSWVIGSASAVLAVGVTSGIVRYVGDAGGAPVVAVKAGEQLELDREAAAKLSVIKAREDALALGEKALAEREAILAAREGGMAPVPPAPAPAEAAPPALAAQEPGPEEKAKAEAMASAKTVGEGFRRIMLLNEKVLKGEAWDPREKIQIVADLMVAMNTLSMSESLMQADQAFGAEVFATGLDAFFPEGMKLSADQAGRLRYALLDQLKQKALVRADPSKPVSLDPGIFLNPISPVRSVLTPDQGGYLDKAVQSFGVMVDGKEGQGGVIRLGIGLGDNADSITPGPQAP